MQCVSGAVAPAMANGSGMTMADVAKHNSTPASCGKL